MPKIWMSKVLQAALFIGLTVSMALTLGNARAEQKAAPAPEALPETLEGVDIRNEFLPSPRKEVGVIHALRGRIIIVHRADSRGYFGKEGDPVYENDALHTLAESRCRIKFHNDDIVTMAPSTSFSVDAYDDRKEEGRKSSLFSMIKGKAMFYALRLFRYRETRFRLKTPTAVVGVRGTKFGAHVYWLEEEKRANAGIQVADSGRSMGPYLAQADPPGGRAVTIVAAGDGQVAVGNITLNPGDVFNTFTGERTFDPDQKTLNQIETEAEVTTGDEKGGEEGGGTKKSEGSDQGGEKGESDEDEGGEEIADLTDAETGGAPGDTADITENLLETTQEQVVNDTENESSLNSIAQGKIKGEIGAIAAIITSGSGAGFAIGLPMYGNDEPSPFTGGAETYTAYEDGHPNNDSYKLILNELNDNRDAAQVDYFDAGTGTNLASGVDPKNTFKYFSGGTYLDSQGRQYLEWGHWKDASGTGEIGVDGGTHYYAAHETIWQIEGLMTHPDYIDYLQAQNASYTYTGGANGTFGDSSAASIEDLSGSFSCQVDFGSRSISQFDINVTGGIRTVHIYNGSGTIDPDGTFDVKNFSGTIGTTGSGQPVTAPGTNAGGAFLGYKAEGIGGLWNATDDNHFWAAGEFHGSR